MTGPGSISIRRAWVALIKREEPDPATWLRRVREDVEALGLPLEGCIPLPGTLDAVTGEVLRHALARRFTEERVRTALRLPEET